MAEIDYPPVQQALKRIRRLSEDEEAQHRAMMRERAVHTQASELRGAREDGREEGLAEGLELGREEGLAEGQEKGLLAGEQAMLIRLLEKRFGPLDKAQRERIQSATSAEIDAWSDRLLEESSIERVLGEAPGG